MTNVCYACKVAPRPLRDPNGPRHLSLTYARLCRPCRLRAQARTRAKHYGVTIEYLRWLRRKQRNACAICEQSGTRVALVVDHDHVTNVVRGLLCNSCNSRIAILDDTRLLPRAMRYVGVR